MNVNNIGHARILNRFNKYERILRGIWWWIWSRENGFKIQYFANRYDTIALDRFKSEICIVV